MGQKPRLAQSALQRRAELHLKAEVDPEGANSWVLSARHTVQLGSESLLAGTRDLVPPRPDCALGCKRKTFRIKVGPRLCPPRRFSWLNECMCEQADELTLQELGFSVILEFGFRDLHSC